MPDLPKKRPGIMIGENIHRWINVLIDEGNSTKYLGPNQTRKMVDYPHIMSPIYRMMLYQIAARGYKNAISVKKELNVPVKIVKDGDDMYTVEVTPPHGTWKSPHPLPSIELDSMLLGMGFNVLEINRAFQEVGVVHSSENTYRYAAKITLPFLLAALRGERAVPGQQPFAEAWLADALSSYDGLRPLDEVIFSADAANYAIPDFDEVSWAFLRLRRRGWLAIEGEMFGLTPEARCIINEIEAKDELPGLDWSREEWTKFLEDNGPGVTRAWSVKKLEKWIVNYPPPGDKKWSTNIRRLIRF